MSSTRKATRPTARAFERLAARRYAARSQRDLSAVLAGQHGASVRAEVLSALNR